MDYCYFVLCVFYIFRCCNVCDAYFVTVDAHAEECFHEKVEMGTKLGLSFEISEGGFLDIDFKIIGPDNQIIHSGERETSGKYTFAAHMPGIYIYCFSNKMSTMTPKVVMFNMEVGEPTTSKVADGEKKENSEEEDLEATIKQLSHMLLNVKHEQEYMSVRDRIHRSINESTNSRVVLWAFFEAIVLVTVVIGQVWYLKRFFEVRRMV